jgi:hypothetical protein
MKTIKVSRKKPRTFYDCDQLVYSNRCGECAHGDYKGHVCPQREAFLDVAVKAGILEKCTDSNGEKFYREIY